MSLRRILNILIVIAVVGAISGVFIIFYNNSKLEDKEFKSANEEVLDSSNDSDEDVDSKTEANDIDDTNSTEDESDISENEVTVESTSSSKNRVIAIVGSMIVILGIGTIIFRTNN